MNELGQNSRATMNFATILAGMALLLFIGMVGYVYLEGWHWIDALYMTFISFSTVGFGEVRPLHPGGRIFTMFIVFSGLIIIAMLSASVTSMLVRREFIATYRTKKMKKQIKHLKGHTILCGAGETGKTVISEFAKAGKPLVVIEENTEVLERMVDQYPKMYAVYGDATKDEVLQEANIASASGLITALSEDAANLYVVISARAMKPDITIVARAVDTHAANKIYKAGATHVISPNLTEGMRMAATVLRPNVVSFLDVMSNDQGFTLRLEEIRVPKGSRFAGKTLRQMEIPQRTGLIVIAIKKAKAVDGKTVLFNPQSSAMIDEGDVLIVLGDRERVEKLESLLFTPGGD